MSSDWCPESQIMCQLCFECITPNECYPLPNGKREDICIACAIDEAYFENHRRDSVNYA